jgi:hypothetical protein
VSANVAYASAAKMKLAARKRAMRMILLVNVIRTRHGLPGRRVRV